MPYRISLTNLSLADQIRYEQVAKDLGLSGSDLIMALVKSFFESRGVKNPSKALRNTRKFSHTTEV